MEPREERTQGAARRRMRPAGGAARALAMALALAVASALAPAAPGGAAAAAAQPLLDAEEEYPNWVGQFTVLSANTLVGALVGGIGQHLRGGSFQDGFTRGALGGAVAYAGKRIAVERFDGAGLLGRQLSAVGSSIVRNASEARPSLEALYVPVGPLRLYVQPGAARPVRARVDLASLVWTAWAIAEPQLSFDAGASLSAGTPVFRVPNKLIETRWGDGKANGLAAGGTILLSDIEGWEEELTHRAFAHERVHTIQDDFVFATLTEPLEGWLFRRVTGRDPAGRILDANLANAVHGLLTFVFDEYRDRPWEMEARYLERRR